MHRHLALRAGGALLALGMFACSAVAAPSVPPDFVFENAFANVTFKNPVAMAFLPWGRVLVAEKRGVVQLVTNGVVSPRPFWDGEREILSNGDRGLIGIAVDPHFAENRFVYFLYTVDPDSDGVDIESAAFGRLTRYCVSDTDSTVVDTTTRTILIGASWREGFASASASHGVASLRWGSDGSLLVSAGEGAHYDRADAGGGDSLQFLPDRTDPAEDIGSFRAQDLDSDGGKVLRIDPATGNGYASNPYATDNLASTRSRVWAYGFRNPFRFCVRPGSGAADTAAGNPGILYVGDVGWNNWEEVDVLDRPGMNLGWPCEEGIASSQLYAAVSPAHHGCGSAGTPENPALFTRPTLYWNHTDSTASFPFGLRGNCTVGGVFYEGSRYPAHFGGRFFFADYGTGWLRVATLDSLQHVVSMQDFGHNLEGPVDMATDPVSGDVYYVSVYTGQVRRLRYVGGSQAFQNPIVHASASGCVGAAPSSIAFLDLGSYDPAGSSLAYSWSFSDESFGSNDPLPSHTYAAPGAYQAILTATNERGDLGRDTVRIVITPAATFPVTVVLDSYGGSDRPIASPWTGNLSGLRIRDEALTQTAASNYAVWNGAIFGPDQEAFFRFDSTTANSPEQDLLLKVQGPSWSAGAIQVVYCATQSLVAVNAYTPGRGWARQGGPWPVEFQPGDEFGARALSNGSVIVYRNGAAIGTASVWGWPHAAKGGRIGLMIRGATSSRLKNFGGGNVPLSTDNNRPHAQILSPTDRSFFVVGEQIVLRGTASDVEEPTANLIYHWDVTIIHNNHQHPDAFVSSFPVDSFPGTNHDDGTGVHQRIRLTVTDSEGLTDTATVSIYPEADLEPSIAEALPLAAASFDTTRYSFLIRNRGRMPASFSRWALVANGMTLATGDTVVAALDSVQVVRTLPSLPGGVYDLRVVADTLRAVTEIDESNNASVRRLAVVGFPTTPVLDSFIGPNGPLKGAWTGTIAGLQIVDQTLTQATGTSANPIWNGAVFGPDQEAFLRFDSLTVSAPEQDLMLKVQGTSWRDGAIQVVYSAPQGVVVVNSYTPGVGWARHGGPWRVQLRPGDQFGARASADGRVRVFRNGVRIGDAWLATWPFSAAGGRIGMLLQKSYRTRITSFGGGNLGTTFAIRAGGSIELNHALDDSVEARGAPPRLLLSPSFPNPTGGTSSIRLELPRPAAVTLGVYDLAGRRIWGGSPGAFAAGRWTLRWPGTDFEGRQLPTGLYLMKITVDAEHFIRRVTLVR